MEYYKKEIAGNAEVELVWVTADNSEKAMEDWAKAEKFPWPTIKFRSARKIDEVSEHAPRGVPGYVLVNADGEKLASSAGSSAAVKNKLKDLLTDES